MGNNPLFTIETEQETDGRFIAEVMEIPGALCYGTSIEEAMASAKALALRVIADELEHKEISAMMPSISFALA